MGPDTSWDDSLSMESGCVPRGYLLVFGENMGCHGSGGGDHSWLLVVAPTTNRAEMHRTLNCAFCLPVVYGAQSAALKSAWVQLEQAAACG